VKQSELLGEAVRKTEDGQTNQSAYLSFQDMGKGHMSSSSLPSLSRHEYWDLYVEGKVYRTQVMEK